MTQHTPTPKLYAFQNVVTDKENYSFDENGTRYGDTPNIAFQMETTEQAAFIVRACNSHDALVAALEKVVLEQERLFDVLSSSSDGSVENRFMLNFLKNQIKENIDIITKARGEVSQ